MTKIFISYRRDDSKYVADTIYTQMCQDFGDDNVFLDVSDIPGGVDFRVFLHKQIAQADVVLVVIGPDWAQIIQERANQANDFVRIEIESALQQKKIIIPVLVKEAKIPDFSKLPSSIQELQWHNISQIRRHPDMKADFARLTDSIKKVDTSKAEPDAPPQQSFRAPQVPKTHENETKRMRAPKLTKSAKQTHTIDKKRLPKQVSAKQKQSDSNQVQKILIGVGALGIIGLIIVGVVMMMRGNGDTPIADEVAVETIAESTIDTANSQATQIQETNDVLANQPTAEVTAIQEIASNTPLPRPSATNTIPPTQNPAPAQTLTSQAELDALATQNMLSQATLTQSAKIAQTQVAQIVLEPTIMFPNGRPIEMTYNSAGFYLRNNGTESNIRMSRLAFRAMNADGFETGNTFDGVSWARFYNFIDRNGHCVAIEVNDQPSWTRPNNCVLSAGSSFDSLLTFMPNDQQIFWDGRNGATQFAIFWDDAEIARCLIADGFCQIRVGD